MSIDGYGNGRPLSAGAVARHGTRANATSRVGVTSSFRDKAAVRVVAIALLAFLPTAVSHAQSPSPSPRRTAKNVALAIGLNAVDPAHYNGWRGALKGCEADAVAMAGIARSQGFATVVLKTKQATLKRFRRTMAVLAATLQSGDTLIVSFAGHGAQMWDRNGDERDDGLDETWCLYNGEVLDDELAELWAKFREGVRITVYSDSCHSGTVLKNFEQSAGAETEEYRIMPSDVAHALRAGPDSQSDQGFRREAASRQATRASVILIAACQDNQLARDGRTNGLFTGELRKTWSNGTFAGSHHQFYRAIRANMPQNQKANFDRFGARNPSFEEQRPWSRTR